MNILDTGIKNVRNVSRYTIGEGSLKELASQLNEYRKKRRNKGVIFFIDDFFEGNKAIIEQLKLSVIDEIIFVSTENEPTTDYIDSFVEKLRNNNLSDPLAIVGMGGGTTMDIAKAVSNLLTNGGKAAEYQGWDLVKVKGVFKIAVPTLSGTGAEATRTCVMTNKLNGLKLGMNSDYTVYDQIIMDPTLTSTVPRSQYFFTGMDAFIHCIEALNGSYRNAIGDSFSTQSINLCRDVFTSEDMMSANNRLKLMVASYLGGCAIGTTYVGVIHPFSAGLSVVLGTRHCLANCIVMLAMEEFYPDEYSEFRAMVEKQEIFIPEGICANLTDSQYEQLYKATIIHEKPLTNALGGNFKSILSKEKVIEIFKKM